MLECFAKILERFFNNDSLALESLLALRCYMVANVVCPHEKPKLVSHNLKARCLLLCSMLVESLASLGLIGELVGVSLPSNDLNSLLLNSSCTGTSFSRCSIKSRNPWFAVLFYIIINCQILILISIAPEPRGL